MSSPPPGRSEPQADALLRRLPSSYALFMLAAAAVVGILAAVRGLSDSDYYWHVTAGRLIVETGQIASVDPFSFTWAGQPWTRHEWLGEVLMSLAVNGLGAGPAAFLFGVAAAGGPLLVGAAARRNGLPTAAVVLAASVAVLVLLTYVTIRPQAISWLLLGALLAGLLWLRPERAAWAWLTIPLFVVWGNLHGLYVVGLGVLVLYVLATLVGRTPMAPRRGMMLAVLGIAVLATMVTPAGPVGLLYPLRYLEPGDWGLRHIAEWQSPDFHDPRNLGLAVLIAMLLLTGMRNTPGWLIGLATLGVAGALLAVRNAPLAAIAALPAVAGGIASWLAARRAAAVRPSVARGRRLMEMGLAALVVAAAIVLLPTMRGLSGDRAVPASFPVAATDVLERVAPDARVLAEYHWGGYVIWRLHDAGARVFVDGRNDMYDQRILDDYLRIRNAADGWQALAERYGVEAILLPPDAAVVPAAEADGWCEAHRDLVAVLVLRSCPS